MTALAYPTIKIADIIIRQDSEGRYCLNDLHKAAGGEARHKPGNWLQLQQTAELIAEVANEVSIAGIPAIKQIQPLSIRAGAPDAGGGSYVVIELVYAYAMWVSPVFHLKVIRAYHAQWTPKKLSHALRRWSTSSLDGYVITNMGKSSRGMLWRLEQMAVM